MNVNRKQGTKVSGGSEVPERRASKDVWAHLFIWLTYLVWAVLLVCLLVFHKAQPEFETFFDRFYQLNLRTYWDREFIRYLVYTAAFGLAVSLAGGFLALFRARRRTDHKKSIVVLGCLYLVLIILARILT